MKPPFDTIETANPVADIWENFENAFLKTFKALDNPKDFALYAHSFKASPQTWSAKCGQEEICANDCADLAAAGEALISLANALPLIFRPEHQIHEVLLAEISSYDDNLIVAVCSVIDGAYVKLLTGPEDAVQFAQCRDFFDDDSDWARAAQTRCIRKTVFGGLDVIEPGAVWFVEWLESQGASTIFSCEGHPHDFHVTFRGSHALAHALASVGNLTVNIFRSDNYPQIGQWKMELDYWPESRAERDKALRKLADEISRLNVMQTPWQRIRQYLSFPV